MSASHKFAAHGLDEKVSSSSVAPILEAVIEEAGVAKGCDKAVGNLLYTLATTFPKNRTEHRAAVSKLISSRAIRSVPQVNAAVKFVTKAASGQPLDQKALENACGAGVHTTPEQIAATVSRVLSENKATLTEERYSVTGKLLGAVNKELPWADGKLMKEEFDKQVIAMIGEMNDDDKNPQKKKEKAKEKEKEKDSSKDAKDKSQQPQESKESANKTGLAALFQVNSGDDDTIGRDLEWAHNTPAQRATHTKNTGGKIRTRFPPEPNGFLHLGHAKSMFLNFGIAKNRVGECILRFDDTNPTEEKQLYIDKVIEAALWLGHQPARVTYSSDYFEQLYELAVKLIKKGGAYVCHQTGDQMEESRKKHEESPWRNRTVEENLTMFENMRKGKYAEGHCTLRMKGDINHPMPCMWDLVAYRIKYAPHPHVGSKWCIYPSYDFTHCIIDSIEDIDFSICTLEFETRRESYFWLLHELDLYKPKVWEFSRLNLEYNVMSKRKLKQLVEEGHVSDWDDPRLLTLMGLRRRGLTPEIINNFCSKVGVSRNDNLITQELFDFCAREYLNEVCPRRMVVNDPVRVTLTNYPENKIEQFKAPLYPQRPASERGERTLPFTRTVYIDREDFRKEDEKGYFRLAPGKTVRLLYSYLITCTDFKTDQAGHVTEILATVDLESNKPTADSDKKKIKGNLHWVSAASVNGEPLQVELRLYDRLFTERDTNELKDDWRAKINPNSLVVKRGLAEAGLADAKTEERFQFERVGFFCVDPDTTKDNLVFNLTVSLRDSKGKD